MEGNQVVVLPCPGGLGPLFPADSCRWPPCGLSLAWSSWAGGIHTGRDTTCPRGGPRNRVLFVSHRF